MIKYGCQDIHEQDIEGVIAVLRSEYLTQGPQAEKFEELVADRVNAKYAITVNSATSALHIACLSLGLGEGDLFWTSPNSFVASANCGIYCGASVDFVDICNVDYNICTVSLEEKLLKAREIGRLPKVLIVVHFAGQPCDMAKIHKLSLEYGFKVIEDASHAIGSHYENQNTGCCQYSDITVFSFHPVKIITTGEGGIATTNDLFLAKKMRQMRTHGITRDLNDETIRTQGGWFYQQETLGYNYRMTDLQAALGIAQLGRLEYYIDFRNKLAKTYNERLGSLPINIPLIKSNNRSSFHLYTIMIQGQNKNKVRKFLYDYLIKNKIGVNVHYYPIYLQPFYAKLGFESGLCKNAEDYYSGALTLPLHPKLQPAEIELILQKLDEGLKMGLDKYGN